MQIFKYMFIILTTCLTLPSIYAYAQECPENRPCFSADILKKLQHLMQLKEKPGDEMDRLVREGQNFTLKIGESCFASTSVPNCPDGKLSISTCTYREEHNRLFSCRRSHLSSSEEKSESDCLSQSTAVSPSVEATISSTQENLEKNIEIKITKEKPIDLKSINDSVKAAQQNESMQYYRNKADEAFLNKDYSKAAQYSKQEMEYYPVVNAEGLKFRVEAPLSELPPRLLSVMGGDQKMLTLSKVVPKIHLCNIQKIGLDSTFGGVGGASENIGLRHSMYDRGRMSLANGVTDKSFYGKYFKEETVMLLIEVPIVESGALNLVLDSNLDWLIAGTKIFPKYIWVQSHGRESIPLDFRIGHTVRREGEREFVQISDLSCKTNEPNESGH